MFVQRTCKTTPMTAKLNAYDCFTGAGPTSSCTELGRTPACRSCFYKKLTLRLITSQQKVSSRYIVFIPADSNIIIDLSLFVAYLHYLVPNFK